MLRLISFLFLVAVFSALLSCEGTLDEQQPEPVAVTDTLPPPLVDKETDKPVFRIDVGPRYIPDTYQYWVFISDGDGLSSEARPMVNDSTITIEFPKSHEAGKSYSINMLRHYEVPGLNPLKRYVMETYTDLAPGDYRLFTPTSSSPQTGTLSTHDVRIINLPQTQASYFGVYGKNLGNRKFNIGKGMIESKTEFYGDRIDLCYYVMLGGECRYVKIPVTSSGQQTVVSYDTMKPMENSVTYKFDRPVKATAATSAVVEGQAGYLRLTQTGPPLPLSSELKFYYPADPYDSYYTQLTAYNEDMSVSHQYTAYASTVPSEFRMWPGLITRSKVVDGVLTTALTHTAAVLHVNSQSTIVDGDNPARCVWSVYMPGKLTQDIKLPRLPHALAIQHPAWAGQTLNFKYGAVTALSGEATYRDYIKIQLQPSAPGVVASFPYPGGELMMYNQLVDSE